MASKYDSAREAWSASSVEATVPEGPGMLGALKRGVLASPSFRNEPIASDPVAMEKPGFQRPTWNTGGMTDQRYGELVARGNGPDPEKRWQSIPEPTNFGERVMQRIGMDSPMIVGGGVAGGVTGGIAAARSALIQSVAADTASQYAEDSGGGWLAQTAAGVLAAMLVPTRLRNPFAGRTTSPAASDASAAANPNAIAAAQSAPVRTSVKLTDSDVAALAKQYKVKPDNIRAVASSLRGKIMIDPTTGEPMIDDFVGALEETQRIFKGKTTPTLAQAAGKYGGTGLVATEKARALGDDFVNARMAGVRDRVTQDLNERLETLIPNYETSATNAKYTTVHEAFTSAKDGKWDVVPWDEIPKRPSSGITKVVDALKERRPLFYSQLPAKTRSFIETKLGDEVTPNTLQDLKADLGNIIDAGKSFDATPALRSARVVATKIKKAVEAEIAQFPDEGSAAYKAANAATKDYYGVFPSNSRVVKAFTKYNTKEQIVSEIFRAEKPVQEVAVMRKIFGDDGMPAIESMFKRELIGNSIGDKPINGVIKELAKEGRGAFYKELLGEERFNTLNEIIRGYKIGTQFDGGLPEAAMRTQSSSLVQGVQRMTAWVMSPLKTLKGAPDEIVKVVARDAQNAAEQQRLIDEMIFDLDLPKSLAQIPKANAKPAEVDRWLGDWATLVARSKVRASMAGAGQATQPQGMSMPSVPNFPAAARSVGSNVILNLPRSGAPSADSGGVR